MVTAGSELTPGTTVDRRYRIRCILGRGGFGRTYLAADEWRFGELCVLKEFVPNSQADPIVSQKLRELFQREASILHKLDHPQIPKFFAGFEKDERLFIAQEYIDGKTYWRLLQERQRQGRTFSQSEIIEWLQHLLQVLDYLHTQNLVHRDISPDNIMLPRGQKKPVLIDFGVVKQVLPQLQTANSSGDLDDLIQASVSVGKFGYAPYEQIRMGQCSPRSDLYALAVTAVVLLTGKPPNLLIDAKSLEWQWKRGLKLDDRLVTVLDAMMAEKPQDRYPSARVVLEELQPLCDMLDLFEAAEANERLKLSATVASELQWQPSSMGGLSKWPTQATAVTGHFAETQADLPQLTPSIAAHAKGGKLVLTQLEQALVPIQSQIRGQQFLTALSSSEPQPPLVERLLNSMRAALHLPQDQLGNAKSLRLSLKQTLILGVLAVLPLGGAVVGVRSPYIASLCWALENCANNQTAEVYRRVVDQANGAGVLLEQARTVEDLQHVREQLADSIAQLNTFSDNPKVVTAAYTVLPRYQKLLTTLDDNLEKQTRAAQLLNRAEAEAQKAAEQTKIAKTLQHYQAAQTEWRRALATLAAIPEETFVSQQAVARSQEYKTRLDAVNLKIQAMTPKTPATSVKVAMVPTAQAQAAQSPVRTASVTPTQPRAVTSSAAPAPRTRTVQQSANRGTSSSTRRPTPARSPAAVTRANPAHTSPLAIDRQWVAGSVITSATQTLKDVSIWIEGKRTEADGRFVANLMIQNSSGRGFGFVPLYAESRDGQGNTVRSRVLFTGTADMMLEPGELLSGQITLLDLPDQSIAQRFTLVIKESTSGDRTFRVPF